MIPLNRMLAKGVESGSSRASAVGRLDCKTQSGSRAIGTIGQSGNYVSRTVSPRTAATGAAKEPQLRANNGQAKPPESGSRATTAVG